MLKGDWAIDWQYDNKRRYVQAPITASRAYFLADLQDPCAYLTSVQVLGKSDEVVLQGLGLYEKQALRLANVRSLLTLLAADQFKFG